MGLKTISLNDKYDLGKTRVFMSGTQAIVRLTLMQKARDTAQGLNTAGYVTGYRGSPVGGLDQQFARAEQLLQPAGIRFEPGLNEDLAATAIWGAQQAEMRGEGTYDGVFSIWYGKGPGVDRSGDVLRHANSAGTAKHGGVLALMGDDHGAESSTVPHQSEFAMMDAMMPILNPAGVQEILDYGIYGFALSRYCGCWVGIKCVHDNIESTAVVDGDVERIKIALPEKFQRPEGGLNIRPSDDRFDQERRLHLHKRFAAVAFARANKLDKIVFTGGRGAKIGIVCCGKSYLDVRQALGDLGIDDKRARTLGLRLLKVAMVWPLDPEIVAEFARGLELVIVVEEKRSLLETQLREQMFNEKSRPVIIGKKDEKGRELFPAYGTLEPNTIAVELAARLLARKKDAGVAKHLQVIKRARRAVRNTPDLATRIPYFCAGCPHNSSTVVPDGGRGYAGIGCHWMVQYISDRHTEGATHMGGEGANWIGEAPFSKRRHVFQNLGDGTYNHSGILAIRAAVASGTCMTYKILYNDAVAMTGGQTHEGALSVEMIAAQVRAEGVDRIVVVSDEPDKHSAAAFPARTGLYHRDELDEVQKELMQVQGVSVLIYDQTCAAEKRRRRKRGTYPDPAKRVFINERVCEGCGDCGVQSNCVAIAPLETRFGRKRRIDQSACNKDYSCLKGFCPSFVVVEGGEPAKGIKAQSANMATPLKEVLPEPELPGLDEPYAVQVTGIGGTGVVTIGQIMGMAAHIEGLGCGIIDMAGLSQKNGAVVSHLKLMKSPDDMGSIRIAAGGADLILGCDLVTTASEHILAGASRQRTSAVVNSHLVMPAQFTHDADFKLPGDGMQMQIAARVRRGAVMFVDATALAEALLGNTIAANMFTLGMAWQKGLIPLARTAIEQAIALNAVAVDMNLKAFEWGRRAAHDVAAVEAAAGLGGSRSGGGGHDQQALRESLDEMISDRVAHLTGYQNADYARSYQTFVEDIRAIEQEKTGGEALTMAVARYLFKLMAYKDEYEVARLYSDGRFAAQVAQAFTGDFKLSYSMAPPGLARRAGPDGHPAKRLFGGWMMTAFQVLAKFKGLRGTWLDPFGYTSERRAERALIGRYRKTVEKVVAGLGPDNSELAVAIASVPEHIRGYGHIKSAAMAEALAREKRLMAAYEAGKTRVPVLAAAE